MTDAFSTTDKVVLTIKGGKEFSAPWVVIHGTDIEDAAASLLKLDPTVAEALSTFDLGLAVAQAAAGFQAKVAAVNGLGAAPAPVAEAPVAAAPAPVAAPAWGTAPSAVQAQPAPAQPAAPPAQWQAPSQAPAGPPQPAGPVPTGPSGYAYVWKTGVKDGRPWKAWFSGQPKQDIDNGAAKDPAIWVR